MSGFSWGEKLKVEGWDFVEDGDSLEDFFLVPGLE